MPVTQLQPESVGAVATRPAVIDAAVHIEVPSTRSLFPYLADQWVEHVTNTRFKGPTEPYYPPNSPLAAREGSRPAASETAAPLPGRARVGEGQGPPPASTLRVVREQVLEGMRAETAVLCSPYPIDSLHNPDVAVAFASAVNDWQIAEWLDKEPRLRASIVVPIQIPHLAAREIDRVGGHPGFVQVALPARTQHPLGSRLYHPVWEAMVRNNLVAGIQFGGIPGNPSTPSGWPSYIMEEYVGMSLTFASQLTSIVSEGVFDQFPTARVALIEAGFTWLPPHMWRFDKEWKNLRRLVPWVKRPPSEYIREHVRLTPQPLDAPADIRQLLQVVDQLGSEDMLLWASHFPRVHTADPDQALIDHLPQSVARKIRSENARSLYGL
jgi:predicted TIM-barrel fold metal-dependent hydrolase